MFYHKQSIYRQFIPYDITSRRGYSTYQLNARCFKSKSVAYIVEYCTYFLSVWIKTTLPYHVRLSNQQHSRYLNPFKILFRFPVYFRIFFLFCPAEKQQDLNCILKVVITLLLIPQTFDSILEKNAFKLC